MGSNPASGISRLTSASAQPWGALTTPSGRVSVIQAFSVIAPRGEESRTSSPSPMPRAAASEGFICNLGSGSRILRVSSCRPWECV